MRYNYIYIYIYIFGKACRSAISVPLSDAVQTRNLKNFKYSRVLRNLPPLWRAGNAEEEVVTSYEEMFDAAAKPILRASTAKIPSPFLYTNSSTLLSPFKRFCNKILCAHSVVIRWVDNFQSPDCKHWRFGRNIFLRVFVCFIYERSLVCSFFG